MKRLIAALLCICICALLIPPLAMAESVDEAMPEENMTESREDTAEDKSAQSAEEPSYNTAAGTDAENGETVSETEDSLESERDRDEEENAPQEESEAELTAAFSGEKEKLHIILIAGQSNAAVGSGKLDTPAITPETGNGFVWNEAWSVRDPVEDEPLRDMAGYIYTRGTTDCVGRSMGFYSAIAAEWYALTGEKAVIIEAGYPGCSIDKWSGMGWTALDIAHINNCFSYIENHCADKYEIVGAGYYWLQGESDTSLYRDPDGILCYKTPKQYEDCFLPVHNEYINAFKAHGIVSPYCGILTCRSWSNLGSNTVSEYCGVRAAQQHLANSHTEIVLASALSDTWLRNGSTSCSYSAISGRYNVVSGRASALFDTVHYCQSAYNIMGLEAADSIYRATRQGITASSFVVYGHNAVRTYESGDTIYLEDNRRQTGELNPEEWRAAQIVFFPTPSCGICGKVEAVLTKNSDGSRVPADSVMQESGYIPDIYKLTEPMTLRVTVGAVTKTFTLARKSYSPVPVEEGFYENIPDINFARALKDRLGAGLTQEQAAGIKELSIANCSIADLSGIEYFTALEKLDCSGNSLTSLDLSRNTELVTLDCSDNLLTELNIGCCEKLSSLSAGGNRLAYFESGRNFETCSLGMQSPSGLTAYRTESGKYLLDIGAFIGAGRTDGVRVSTELTLLPDTNGPQLALCDALPDTLSYTYTTASGYEMSVSVSPQLSEEPAVRALQDYLIIAAGKTGIMDIDTVSESVRNNVSVSWNVINEEGNTGLINISGAEISALKPGTAVVSATVKAGSEAVAVFEVRIDITEYDITNPVSGVLGVSLADRKTTVELYSTSYTELEVLPELLQLSAALSAYPAVPENTGVAVERAEFTNSAAADSLLLVPNGDRVLRIVPTDSAVNSPSTVAKTYKSSIKVFFKGRDSAFTTEELTITVKKTVPKIKAASVKINSWEEYKGVKTTLSFTGGNVTAIQADPAAYAPVPDWLEADYYSMSLIYSGLPRAKKSGTVKLLCTVEGWERKPVPVSVGVTASSTPPSLKLSKSELSIVPGTYDRAELSWSMKTPEYDNAADYPVSVTYILDGSGYKSISYKNGEVLTVEVDNEKRTVSVSGAVDDGRNHSYRVFLYCAGKEFSFTVKTVSKAVGLKLKASGAINRLVEQSPVTITPTVSNFNISTMTGGAVFRLEAVKACSDGADCTGQFTMSAFSGKSITLTIKPGNTVPAGSYIAAVSLRYSEVGAVTASVKFTVNSSAVKAGVSAKASGYIDVIRRESYVSVKPTWKNCYTHVISENDIRIYSKTGKTYTDCTGLFGVSCSDSAYTVKYAGDVEQGRYYLRIEAPEAVSGYVTITVKQGKATVKASTAGINLFLKDRYDKKTISLTLQDASLNNIGDVRLDSSSAKLFGVKYVGNGQCELTWKDSTPSGLKAGRTQTVKLSVFLEGSARAAATVSVKVTAR